MNPNRGGSFPPHPPVGGRPASPEPPPKGVTVNDRGRFALPPRRMCLSSRASFTEFERSLTSDRSRINLHGSRLMRSDPCCPQSNPSGGGVGGRSRPLTGGLGVFPQVRICQLSVESASLHMLIFTFRSICTSRQTKCRLKKVSVISHASAAAIGS